MSYHPTITRRQLLGGSAALAGGAALTGCSDDSATAVPDGWTGVTFMSIGSNEEQQIFKDMIAAAQAEVLDDLQIKIIWKPAPGDDWQRTMQLFASGTAADIQRMNDDAVYTLAIENKIHQLDPWMLDERDGMVKDDYAPQCWTYIAVEDYQFGLLPATSTNAVYYNKEMFDTAGIEAPTSWEDAWEWDEFVESVQSLTKKSGDRAEVYGVGFPYNVVAPQAYGAGDAAFNEDQTEAGMGSPAAIESLDALAHLVWDGFAPTPDIEQLPLFNSAKLAMMWSSMSSTTELSDEVSWDIMPWPKSPTYAMTKNYTRAFVIPKTSENPRAAYRALKALCGKASSKVIAESRWAVPYLKEVAESSAFLEQTPPDHANVWVETLGEVDGHPVEVVQPKGPIGDAWSNSFVDGNIVDGWLNGQLATEEYVERARQRVNDEIDRREWSKTAAQERLLESGALTDPDAKFLG